MDFTPNSLANIALRKTDMTNFALNNEGNHYNNLFYKVLGLRIECGVSRPWVVRSPMYTLD